ncbi:MAG: ATP-binding protein [Thermoanaerobaculia bacterium]
MTDLYIGRTVPDGRSLYYSSRDLVTHGVCVGMTGSGKTGLCIGLLEELLLADVPLFLLDPKGDVANLLLVFPDLSPSDFLPWVDPESARRAGRSIEEEAAAQATAWKAGLEKSGVPLDSLRALRDRVAYRVFTPGSGTGRGINLLGSFDPPAGLRWETDEEALRDEVRGQVSGLLSLAGIPANAVTDPRHILLARILEERWRAGAGLDLAGIIALAENPPFRRVGAMELDGFLPQAERRELAHALNNLLASPDFESWREGDPLDPEALLRDASGRPGCNLFSIAHLDDRERMFFVSRFLERYWTWVRTQTGTSDLRALLYFDEVMGFLPPVAEPPSKRPLLTLLKQGRAFGCGALLVTQNPVDLDYKALSNAGTWFVGRLQAERDKERLLDGLESAGIGMPRAEVDRTISGLEKRRFLLHDVHRPGGPVVFESRWARAYLRGPVALRQIAELARLAGAEGAPARKATAPSTAELPVPAGEGGVVPASLDPAFQHRFAPGAGSGRPLAGEPAALVEVRVSRQRPPVSGTWQALVRFGGGDVARARVEKADAVGGWAAQAPAGARYGPLPGWATKRNALAALEKDARDVVAAEGLEVEGAPALGVLRNPGEDAAAFEARLQRAAEAEAARRAAKVLGPLDRKIESLDRRIAEEERELARDRAEKSRAAGYSAIDVGASVLGTILGGGKRSVGTGVRAGGRAYGRIRKAEENIKESEEKIAAWTRDRDALRAEREGERSASRAESSAASGREPTRVPVKRTDVRALEWYVLWS